MKSDGNNTDSYITLAKDTPVGHYRIIEKIGAGGMGEVFLAEDTQLKRKVALKFMPVRYQNDAEARARFMREAQAAAVLNHQNIVTVYEIGEYNGSPFIAMEHCPGRVLRDYRIGKTLSLDQILDLIISITDGLQAAHSSGIVHRDLKPSNIVIDEFGKPKLLDFGLASIRDADRLTKTGSTLGTIGYMAPEQISGKEVDHRSDLFSLGVILYELIALQRPFTGDNDAAVINSVLKDNPQPLARYCADVPGELQRIVNKLLEKNKEFRYQSAADVLSDLRRLKDGAALSGVSTGLTTRQRLMFFGLPTLVVLILVVVLSTRLYLPTTDEVLPKKPMLAVLPFENLGDPADEYFADGMTDELFSRLSTLENLRVIWRTSTRAYKETVRDLPHIAKELGVDYIVEGTVRWDKTGDTSLVRITPHVIRISDNTRIWATSFERPLVRIFEIQKDIATQIAGALGVVLAEHERKSLAALPTTNAKAYEYYLRAKKYFSMGWYDKPGDVFTAEQLQQRAIELDPHFAHAYAELGIIYLYDPITGNKGMEDGYAQARQYIDRAFELDSTSADIRYARGKYYRKRGDFDSAMTEFERVFMIQPNHVEALLEVATIKRRQGQWEEATSMIRNAIELSPSEWGPVLLLGHTLGYRKHYAEALECFDRAIELSPISSAYGMRGIFIVLKTGIPDSGLYWFDHVEQLGFDSPEFRVYKVLFNWYKEDFEEALRVLKVQHNLMDTAFYHALKGEAFRLVGDTENSRLNADLAIEIAQRKLSTTREESRYREVLGVAYAVLGRREDAIREGRRMVELTADDAVEGPSCISSFACICAIVGEYDLALDQIERLLADPSPESPKTIMLYPQYKPLHDHPRFKALMEKYGGDDEI